MIVYINIKKYIYSYYIVIIICYILYFELEHAISEYIQVK